MKLFKNILSWLLVIVIGVLIGIFAYFVINRDTVSIKDVISSFRVTKSESSNNSQSTNAVKEEENVYKDSSSNLQYTLPKEAFVMKEAISDFSTNKTITANRYRLLKKQSADAKYYDVTVMVVEGLDEETAYKSEITNAKSKIKKLAATNGVAGQSNEVLFGQNSFLKTKYTNSAWSSWMDVYEVSLGTNYILVYQKIDPEQEVVSSTDLTKLLESITFQAADSTSDSEDLPHSALLDNSTSI